MYICKPCAYSAQRDQKRADSLERELGKMVWAAMWVLRTKSRSSIRVAFLQSILFLTVCMSVAVCMCERRSEDFRRSLGAGVRGGCG